jgi:flagellar motility protein MotE (MotC chaperone)
MSKLPRLLPLIAIAIGGVVLVRAVGIAPGLFQGAVAWAEEAVPAEGEAAPPRPVPAVCALTPEQLAEQAGISPAELRVIQSLKDRRGELDIRDNDFATMLPLMAAAEQKLDERIKALEAVRAEVQTLLGQVDEKEKAEIDRLVAVYSAMRPKDAAAVFTTLSDDVRLPVAAAMRPRSLAAIMSQMPPAAARELTEKLARRFEAQQRAAAQAFAAADAATGAAPAQAPTQTPAQTAAAPAATAPAPTQTAAAPAATAPQRPRPAATRPANRPANRPAAQPARPPAGSAAATAQTPPAPTQPQQGPRQSVQ